MISVVLSKRVRQSRATAVAELPVQLSRACASILNEHLARLRQVASHANRLLHYDQVLAAHLIGFFDPVVRSLRTMDVRSVADASTRASLDHRRVARSTLSDAMADLPASALMPLLEALLRCLPDHCSHPDLQDLLTLKKRIHAIDGSYFRVPADVLWALAHRRRNNKIGRQVRLDLHLDVLRFVPVAAQVDGKELGSESAAFVTQIDSGVVYLADRNFVDYDFLHAVLTAGSDFVVRLKKSGTTIEGMEDRPLSESDKSAGVRRDQIVRVPGSRWSSGFSERALRLVTVWDPVKNEEVRLLTTLLDVPVQLIGKLYRHRWSIELFFRWLKCVAKVRHLFSESSNGITMQFYVMIIATLMLHLSTGTKPSVYCYTLMSLAASGNLVLEKVPEVLERLARERELERLRRAKKKK